MSGVTLGRDGSNRVDGLETSVWCVGRRWSRRLEAGSESSNGFVPALRSAEAETPGVGIEGQVERVGVECVFQRAGV